MSVRWGVLDIECLFLMESSYMSGNEMLEIYNEYHLTKYITTPCARIVDPLHPTLDESIDMICNLRTVNLITRGLPRNLLGCLLLFIVPTPYGYSLRNDFQTDRSKT